MAITASVTVNLEMDSPNDLVLIHAVQGEYYSRQVIANLKQNGSAYTIPSEAVPVIRYRRADGKVGFYNYDPSGNCIATIRSNNHSVLFTLAAEMCSIPGRVRGHVDLYSKTSGNRLSAFYFYVDVEAAATDPEIFRETNVTGVQEILEEVIGNIYTPGSSVTGVVVDNTLSIPGAVSDAKVVGDRLDLQDSTIDARLDEQDSDISNIVLVQPSQPPTSATSNKLWVDSDTLDDGTEVPDMDDIVSEFSTTKIYNTGDYVNHDGHIYKYISGIASSGAWINSKWERIILCDELTRLFNLVQNLRGDSNDS